MIIKKWYILAGGSATRWKGYQGVKNKCYLKIDGEKLLDRSVRLLKENGVKAKDIKIVLSGYDSKRRAFEGIAREAKGEFGILLGDCYYTEEIIKDATSQDVNTWKHYYCCLPNPWTGCPWEEGYIHLVPNWEWWLEKMTEFNQKCDASEINFVKDFQIDRYLRGYSPNECRKATLDEHDIFWRDETDDFDFPADYDNFMLHHDKNKRGERADRVSVIMPLYNSSKWAKEIMAQLSYQKRKFYPETELIAVDDGSTDDKSYMEMEGWTVIHQPNKGAAAARNTGLKASTGKYIAFVDADDKVEPSFLHTLYQIFRSEHPDIIVFPFYAIVAQAVAVTDPHKLETAGVWSFAFSYDAIKGQFFDESKQVAEDRDWLKRVVTEGKFIRMATEAIYRYDWGANPDSLSKRFNRGEIK